MRARIRVLVPKTIVWQSTKESTRFGLVLFCGLTLAELEALTSLRTTRFLTLNLTSVTSHEALSLQCRLVLRINLNECASDSQTQRLCLSLVSATVQVDLDIIFLSYIQLCERLLNDVLQRGSGEINLQLTTVDSDLTSTLTNVNACYCSFTTT